MAPGAKPPSGKALFFASKLPPSGIMNVYSALTKLLNFNDSTLVIDMYEARPGPLEPYHHLSEWLSKNQDLYIHGRKLKTWMDMHLDVKIHRSWYDRLIDKAVSRFRDTKSGSKGRKAHNHKSWRRNCEEIKRQWLRQWIQLRQLIWGSRLADTDSSRA